MRSNNSRSSRRKTHLDKQVATVETVEPRVLLSGHPVADPVNRDAPVNDGIVNGSFESYTGEKGWAITEIEGWYGVRAQTVNQEFGVDPDQLPSSEGIEIWRGIGRKTYAGYNQIELDGRGNVVDGVYQKFSTDEPTNLMFAAYARKPGSSDIEVYIDGHYVETVSPPTIKEKHDIRQAYFYALEAGEHSILFKEVTGQNNGQGAVIDNVRLVSDHMKAHLDSAGRHTHNFHEHVSDLFGPHLMAPGQTEYDAKGFEKVSDTLYRGNNPITGLRPVIEEAIDREIRRNPRLEGEALEAKIANRLTNLNDFEQLQTVTQDKLIEMTGIDFRAMSKQEREKTINHLLHSPIPFGSIEEVLTPDTTIDLGYTHTLDKNWTRVGHLGGGVWQVWIISNNNNGSHTGHNLGEFRVQLSADLSVSEAKAAANAMIRNTNNNNRLALDEAAKDILYGVTPRLDPVNRDAPVNDGIVNGSFESYTGEKGWAITEIEGWYGVRAQTVNQEFGVDPDQLPSSEGIEIWRGIGRKTYAGYNQIELDGRGNVVDGVYQKFSTDEPTNLMFAAYARKPGSSDIEVYIDGHYVETVSPPTIKEKHDIRQAYFYALEAGEHSILFKEVTGQNNGQGAVIDNVRLVSDHMKAHLDSAGRHTHNFHEHVSDLFGPHLMAPGQTEYDAKGFEKVSDTLYRGNNPITGLRPVIEEAIDREIRRNPRLEGEALEAKIANRLTNLNDFEQLQTVTQDKLIEMTGIDFRAMSKQEREKTINHLLHSPIPFGSIEEVLTPDTTIDLGYTHTLDKNWTRVGHLGGGVWQVWIISNNNNGSHTGHNLGEFRVQLSADLSVSEAKAAANAMIRNTNNNNRLALDEAAKDILYGVTPRLDPVNRDAPVNDGIVNGSFESYTGEKGWAITEIEGWYGVRAQTVNQEFGVDPDQLPSSEGIEIWRGIGRKTYAGYNQIELDGRGNVVDGVYQKFSTDEPTNLMFAAYARKPGSSDIEVYIDGHYVETVSPPTIKEKHDIRQAYFYALEAGEHSILFKEVTGQNNGQGAVIDNVRLVSDHMKAHLDSAGRHTHNFHEHVSDLFGPHLMAPGQTEYDAKGFEKVSDTLYRGNNPITGLRPVIEEAIDREIRRNPRLEGEALEAKIANRLTNLNDFEQLQTVTQDKLIEMTGIDFRAMSKQEREKTINHLLHSPIPFGSIEEVLTPDTTIDLGYTHTLDKNWTRVGHLGGGVWQVWIISNNNNGSHTGHNLGEFRVQLSADLSVSEAKAAANAMIRNTNNNNRLALDEAAKDILYGVTPRLDPVNRDAPVNDGIVNGSFESYTGEKGWAITEIEGWYGVRAQTVNQEFGVDPDQLPSSEGIEIWRGIGRKTYAGYNQIELDGRGNVVDGVYQKFSTDEPTNLMFAAYARKPGSSDIEVYIDGHYVETVSPPTIKEKHDIRQAYFYALEAGEHSILFKEVTGQNNGQGAVIDNVRLVSDHMKAHLDSAGRHTHNFHEHVSDLFGPHLMAPGQTEYDAKGFEKVSDTLYRGNNPITGLRPVIEEAIDREIRRNPRLEGEALEAKIANRLTNLNDFEQLQTVTQDKLIEMTGIDFRAMSKQEREKTINHLLHSPIPFGSIEEVLTPDTTIDLGYTHTLDKNWTRVGHLGGGVWQVWIISNNNNGSHTGHNLGEFRVQLSADLSVSEAKAAANAMIRNTNNNNRLALDEAAKDILYGVTPRLDPVNRDAPVNDGIVNGSFESYTGEKGWAITEIEGWYGVRAQTVNQEFGVDPDQLPSSEGIEIWRGIGRKTYAGYNQIELDGRGNVVDGVYQKFSTDQPTNLMFAAYARKPGSSDIEVYIDGHYVETVSPPTIKEKHDIRQAYFYALEAGEHSILFKEVTGQNNGQGAVIDNVRLVSDHMKAHLDSAGRHTHNFHEHVSDLFGPHLMAPGQTEYDAKGFEKVSDTLYRGNNPITGLRPVIEEAIDREIRRNPRLDGEALEAKIANRLTNLNDFEQLQTVTQDKLIEMTGIDFRAMSKQEREKTINHLLHSPIPFGSIEEVLTPDTTIDLGYTHTLDKNWTRVGHLGGGVWQVWIISNNNNGSHTGHNLGEFRVQLSADLSVSEAKAAANAMIRNTNNNNRLTLDEAAKDILYGVTPRLDPVNRDAPVNDGIVNGSFESYTGEKGTNEATSDDTGLIATFPATSTTTGRTTNTTTGENTDYGAADDGSTEATDSVFTDLTPIFASLDS